MSEPMLKWFDYYDLSEDLQNVARRFCGMAEFLVDCLAPGPERSVALRKLLEAKEAAVRAKLYPGQ